VREAAPHGDQGGDQARPVFNAMIDKRPAPSSAAPESRAFDGREGWQSQVHSSGWCSVLRTDETAEAIPAVYVNVTDG
jgi:hypothetical protein